MNLTGKKYAKSVQELVIFKPSLTVSEMRRDKNRSVAQEDVGAVQIAP